MAAWSGWVGCGHGVPVSHACGSDARSDADADSWPGFAVRPAPRSCWTRPCGSESFDPWLSSMPSAKYHPPDGDPEFVDVRPSRALSQAYAGTQGRRLRLRPADQEVGPLTVWPRAARPAWRGGAGSDCTLLQEMGRARKACLAKMEATGEGCVRNRLPGGLGFHVFDVSTSESALCRTGFR